MYKEWMITADQWEQEYWAYRDGTMIQILHDNKCGTHEEILCSLEDFMLRYKESTSEPFPEIIDFINSQRNV